MPPGVMPGPVEAAALMRRLILDAAVPEPVADALGAAYAELGRNVSVALRSSATPEDLPEASFTDQQDTFRMWPEPVATEPGHFALSPAFSCAPAMPCWQSKASKASKP